MTLDHRRVPFIHLDLLLVIRLKVSQLYKHTHTVTKNTRNLCPTHYQNKHEINKRGTEKLYIQYVYIEISEIRCLLLLFVRHCYY